MKLRFLPILAVLLCSCAATSIKQTWKSPLYQGGPVTRAAVLAIDQRPLLRQGFENRFSSQLKKYGVKPITTYDLMTLTEINSDKKAAGARLLADGADSLITLRLVDTATYYRETRPGGALFAPITTGIETYGWYDYYSVAYMDMSPTFGNLKVTVFLEANLFDLQTGKRLWSGLSETVIKENTDAVAEMDPIVSKILAAMHKDGLLQ